MQLDKADISDNSYSGPKKEEVINEVLTDENQGGENRNRKPPDRIPDNSIDGDEDLPWTRTVPVLAKPHPLDGILGIGGVEHLPGAEGNSAVADGKGEIGTEKAGLVEKFRSKSIKT